MKVVVLAGAAIAVAGCITASQTYGPDGRVAYSITCKGAVLSMASCFEEAGKRCGTAGYDVIGGGNETGFVATSSFAGSTSNRSLVVSCKR